MSDQTAVPPGIESDAGRYVATLTAAINSTRRVFDMVNALTATPEERPGWADLYDATRLLNITLNALRRERQRAHDAQTARPARIKLPDWHCMGCGADYDGDAELHICLPGGPGHE